MRIGIHTASTSVRLALESIIAAAGYTLAPSLAEAELIVRDSLHPASTTLPEVPTLTLAAAGATGDDMLTCPLRPYALIQRLMVRAQTQSISLNAVWTLDLLARQLMHAEAAPVTLTEKECALLKIIVSAHPEALTRELLLREVWGMAGEVDTHTLETHIYRLRAKLAELTPSPGDIFTAESAYRWDTKS